MRVPAVSDMLTEWIRLDYRPHTIVAPIVPAYESVRLRGSAPPQVAA
jgi:hypothetical protein